MNNHTVLPRVLVDDLTFALVSVAAQLEHVAGPDISAVNQTIIDKATDALEATKHHLSHPDHVGDRLRFATRLLQSADDDDLAALDRFEAFELAERAAWWKDQAEARLTTPSLAKLADQIRSTGAPERIRARLTEVQP